jgi:Pyridoxamine 5'-phosphate oxidase
MSIPVDLDALRDELAGHDRPAYVVTAGNTGSPHLVATFLTWEDGAFATGCGATTARNLAERPQVSVVVPPNDPGGYSLIFDALGEVVPGEQPTLRLTPRKAVLHRPAAGPDAAGGCGHDCAPLGG